MAHSATIREQLIASFRAELAEHVQTMADGLLALEQGRVAGVQRQETLETVFRAAHSLKGAARAMSVTAIEQLAHALENVLDALQRQAMEATPEHLTVCYRALDAIESVQAAYEAGELAPPLEALVALTDLNALASRPRPQAAGRQPEPGPEAADTPREPAGIPAGVAAGEETVRVSVNKLDALMAQLGELLVARIRTEQRLGEIRRLQEQVAAWQRDWAAVRGLYGRLAHGESNGNGVIATGKELSAMLGYVRATQQRLQDVSVLVNDLSYHYAHDATQMQAMTGDMESEIKRIRMLPLHTITGPFSRMVRDLAQEAGKEAVLVISGGEIELDRRVLEQIKDPLTHLLRNAIDHGIEPPDRRAALGKARAGTVTLTAEQRGQDVAICVADDGAGLDLEAIRGAVARRLRADAPSLGEAELVDSIFTAGITTMPIITATSGRGIGLSVVRRNVEALRGRVEAACTPGQGTSFTLTLPLTLTSVHGLVVQVSGQTFVLPLNDVERILAVRPGDVLPVNGRDAIHYGGQVVALARLDDVLGLDRLAPPAPAARTPAVLLAVAGRRIAFAVDAVVGAQEVVVKGLSRQLARVAGVGGATVIGSGEVVLILNPADLLKLATAAGAGGRPVFGPAPEPAAVQPVRPRRHILVVDDSITTRTLEKNILEAVGYDVRTATDGEEAWQALASDALPDLVISDVLMPCLDGFDLTRRIKGTERTAALPVILVTSLDSEEHKVRGIEAGADAYIVKSGFDQNNLLETIEMLV